MKKSFYLTSIIVLAIIVLLIIIRFVVIATKDAENEKKKDVQPITVKLERVIEGDIFDIGSFTGNLEADSTFTVSPKTAGRVKEINFKLGDKITYGDVVARLDNRAQELAVQEQEIALMVARVDVDSSMADVENARAKLASKEVELRSMDAKIRNTKHQVTTAQNDLANMKAALGGAEAEYNLAIQNLKREQVGFKDGTTTQATLDAALAEADVKQANVQVAKSKVASAENHLNIALTDVEMQENNKEIVQTEVNVAQSDLKIAETAVRIANELVKKQEAILDAARERLSYTEVRAEWRQGEGADVRYVSERLADPGALLAMNDNIIRVVDTSKLKVAVTAIERDFVRLQIGQSATVYVQASMNGDPTSAENRFSGKIIRKSPVIDELSRQGRFEIEIENHDGRLHPGAFARIEIVFQKHEKSLIVPSAAICQRNDQDGIFVSRPQADGSLIAVFVPIVKGIKNKATYEITPVDAEWRGKLPNARIVTIGNHLLKDQSAIRIPDAN